MGLLERLEAAGRVPPAFPHPAARCARCGELIRLVTFATRWAGPHYHAACAPLSRRESRQSVEA